jgi:hypothetical protein
VKISFERSGGFGAMINSINIDTDALHVKEQQHDTRNLVEKARFFDLPSNHLISNPQR